ncbi:acid-sensing ion channel 1 isoform X2 [Brachionus plicatilis]|uniref:Acid-sensing ion channel 1 isoform X2 n=1 Tax=Brachionus plicatilis TaxID=10195 RepID=A0A3M7SIH4_BRAPC|nr:acid-sensing ion channel 1 isoform X2 [Brachionus plicatilis]
MKSIYLNLLKNQVESSSIHAIPNILRTKTSISRILWSIAFIVSFSACVYQVVMLIVNFFEFKTIVRMELVQSFDEEFPAVTFCNLNPFDFSLKENQAKMSEFLNESMAHGNENYLKMIKCNLNNSLSNLEGFSIEKMLILCQYDSEECNVDDFVQFEHITIFGRCYTFNSGRNSSGHKIPIRKRTRPELVSGLNLKLFIGALEYQPCWEPRYGAIVNVHNRSSPPLITDGGMMVQTGSETNLILNKVNMKKLPKPYSNCIKDLTNINEIDSIYYRNTFDSIRKVYRQHRCIVKCSLNRTIEENIKRCSSVNLTTQLEKKICILNLTKQFSYFEFCSNECPVECDSSYYSIVNSLSSFPSKLYSSYLLSDESFRSKFPYENISMEQVKESVLSVNVYFGTNFNQNIEEVSALDFLSLLGNLGGQLGLFLGAIMTCTKIFYQYLLHLDQLKEFFSKSGYINRPHRSRLTARNLEATTLLVSNMDLLNKNTFLIFSMERRNYLKINYNFNLIMSLLSIVTPRILDQLISILLNLHQKSLIKPIETQAIMEIGIISCGESKTDEIAEQPLAKKTRLESNKKAKKE